MMNLSTGNLFLDLLIFAAGTWVLVKGCDFFVDSAAAVARHWHVSELVIGLTLVSIGTSLPELCSSVYAQLHRESDFVIGNVAGSCVTNITLVLGAAVALGGTMRFPAQLFTRDLVVMNVLFLLTGIFFFATKIPNQANSGLVFGIHPVAGWFFLAMTVWYIRLLLKHPESLSDAEEDVAPHTKERPLRIEFAVLLFGLVMITAGSKAMVDTVVSGAERLGISTIIISSTIVAFGTSVPELAVSLTGILKKKPALAIGNVIGSNIFNILLIFGSCAAIGPLGINSGIPGMVNTLIMIPTGLLLGLFMWTGRELKRWEGFVLLLLYVAFLGYNVAAAVCKF